MVKKTQTTNTPDQGLPEISEKKYKNLVLLILLISLLLLLGIHFIFNSKTTKSKTKFVVEESYTLPSNEEVAAKSSSLKEKPETKHLSEQQLALLQAKQKELQQRLSASLMLFNQSDTQSNAANAIKSPEKITSSDPNSQFLQQTSRVSEKTIPATRLGPLNQFIGEGQLIHAILETAINSDLPGSLRAII